MTPSGGAGAPGTLNPRTGDSMRVRFAPSPTGYLHVGGARTALFNWLLARHHGGTFVLRIEDTDRDRSSEAHTRAILEGMTWLGLDWDEGPHFQSEGVERHRSAGERLLAEGKAYRDFTDPAALRAVAEARGIGHPSILAREKADALAPGEAEGRARAGEPHAIRLRVPEGETRWDDLVHGEMSFRNEDLDDLVILRSDGTPIYNLAVVSDDHHMGITHVIRGDDHLSNTPKQVLLYRALGYPVPRFGHLPMILGPDGKRLSKRHGATAVGEYRHLGILPDAMVNFLALLGWSPGDDREVMDRDELVARFSLDRVVRKSAVFDLKKLEWLNGQHLSRIPVDRLLEQVRHLLAAAGHSVSGADPRLGALVGLLKVRVRTLDELAVQVGAYLAEPPVRDAEAVAKHWKDREATARILSALREVLEPAPWEEPALEEAIRGLAEGMGVGAGKVIHPLRVALTGQGVSPGIFEVLVALGREGSLSRLDDALRRLGEDGSVTVS